MIFNMHARKRVTSSAMFVVMLLVMNSSFGGEADEEKQLMLNRELRLILIGDHSQPTSEQIKVLLEKGADPNARYFGPPGRDNPPQGSAPLHWVSWMYREDLTRTKSEFKKFQLETLNLLLEFGADANIQTEGGHTPLLVVVSPSKTQMARCLIAAGADVNHRTSGGDSVLSRAAGGSGSAEFMELLIANGADFRVRSDSGQTLLALAASCGQIEICKLLIERGIDITSRDKDGVTALMLASTSLSRETVSGLIESGANVNARSKEGKTPLMFAAENKYYSAPEVIETLIVAGADINAISKEKPEGTYFSDGIRTPLMYAADTFGGNPKAIRLLLAHEANIEAQDQDGMTPLMLAVKQCSLEAIELLLVSGAKVHIQNKDGNTALSCISPTRRDGKPRQVAELLIKHGADINQRIKKGTSTPFARLCVNGQAEFVEYLIEAGANVNFRSIYGYTPIMWVARFGSAQNLLLLLDAGADPTLGPPSMDNETSLSLAEKNSQIKDTQAYWQLNDAYYEALEDKSN